MANLRDLDLYFLKTPENICKDCAMFAQHKEKGWYFWEGKKDCSQKLITSQN